uniref:Circadian clock-controlled protein n=1 Tax=Timema monikensis TaxID=170555 RepID=A0A7R9EI09_9NEOP|nr:unnamed protein product [Timema monikensis]
MLHGIISLAFGLTSVAVLCTSIKLPSYISPCSRNDPKLNECALRSARQGIPSVIKGDRKYKIPVLDPLLIERLHTEQSGLKFDVTNVSFIGLSTVELLDVNVDLEKNTLGFTTSLSKSSLLGDADVSGKILILPITGNGKLNVTLVNSSETFKMHMEKYKQDNGKEYWRVIGSDVPKFYVTRAYIHIDNLFNGDKVLAFSARRLESFTTRIAAAVTLAKPSVEGLKLKVDLGGLVVKFSPQDPMLVGSNPSLVNGYSKEK